VAELLQDSVVEDEENDEEFELGQDDIDNMVDDETTMEAEERLQRDISAQDEIALLEEEGSLSMEELRHKYNVESIASSVNGSTNPVQQPNTDESKVNRRNKRRRNRNEGMSDKGEDDDEENIQTKQQKTMDDDMEEGALVLDRLEASAQIYQTTRASRPYLIPSWVKLREYQHTGLNWLVSLQSRRLNGILADEMVCPIDTSFLVAAVAAFVRLLLLVCPSIRHALTQTYRLKGIGKLIQ
jgi:E1A-binding protein p400